LASPRPLRATPDAAYPTVLSNAFLARLGSDLDRVRGAGLLRTLETRTAAQHSKIEINGAKLVNFTSNDYLGLAADPRVLQAVRDSLPRQGFGAGAAALLSGRSSLHLELEQRLARFTGAESALLFSSGYLANLGALPALISKQDFVVHDRLNHASLIDGVVASGAKHRRYTHADVAAAKTRLATASAAQTFLVTESLFSMDGDIAPLPALQALAGDNNAVLYVDDAHGFGVTGAGRGAAAVLDLGSPVAPPTIVMLTLGKALGSIGAAILAPATVKEYLVQNARTFIYDTALPAVCAGAALQALDILEGDPILLQCLHANIKRFRSQAETAGIALMASETPIQPLLIGDDRQAVDLAERLVAAGYYVRAIRPPTVPPGTSRLRITLTAKHTATQIDGLIATLAECMP
jgi:8-amino-7-oxononanoate synthase